MKDDPNVIGDFTLLSTLDDVEVGQDETGRVDEEPGTPTGLPTRGPLVTLIVRPLEVKPEPFGHPAKHVVEPPASGHEARRLDLHDACADALSNPAEQALGQDDVVLGGTGRVERGGPLRPRRLDRLGRARNAGAQAGADDEPRKERDHGYGSQGRQPEGFASDVHGVSSQSGSLQQSDGPSLLPVESMCGFFGLGIRPSARIRYRVSGTRCQVAGTGYRIDAEDRRPVRPRENAHTGFAC